MKIKICCIKNIEEAELAINLGADVLGLVSEMPSGPGVIEEDLIAEIAAKVPSSIETFLLTSKINAAQIIEQHKRCKTSAIQLVDKIKITDYPVLREALPNIKLVQVIHVRTESEIEEAQKIQDYVDYILLDSGNPDLERKELGGTGRTHNWDISRKIVQSVKVPVFLAGGLNPSNICDAVNSVKPNGVDVCSGVRTNGNLDAEKLSSFIKNSKLL